MKRCLFESMLLTLLIATIFSVRTNAQCTFTEEDGVLVIETENFSNILSPWKIVEEYEVSGGKYITYTGPNNYSEPNGAEIFAKFRITNPGRYQFCWYMRQPDNVESDKANDSWLDFPDARYYGDSELITGYHKYYGNAKGSFKLDGRLDFHSYKTQAYIEFDTVGVYTIKLAGRSKDHQIDKIFLIKDKSLSEIKSGFWPETGNCHNDYSKDCAGVINGGAYIDNCNYCVEGSTGNQPCNIDFSQYYKIPGTLAAVNFSELGQGISYRDSDSINTGGYFREYDGVDIIPHSTDGYVITDIEDNEWLSYKVDVDSSTVYTLNTYYSLTDNVGSFTSVQLDGELVVPEIKINRTTNNPDTYRAKIDYIRLSKGKHELRFNIHHGGFRLKKFYLIYSKTKANNQPPVSIAGDDIQSEPGELIILGGGKSADPENDKLSYFWSIDGGAEINFQNSSTPVVSLPSGIDNAIYHAILKVYDGVEFSLADTVQIYVGTPSSTQQNIRDLPIVYHNRVEQFVYIENVLQGNFKIYSTGGMCVHSGDLNDRINTISLDVLPKGVYIFSIKSVGNVINKKILVK